MLVQHFARRAYTVSAKGMKSMPYAWLRVCGQWLANHPPVSTKWDVLLHEKSRVLIGIFIYSHYIMSHMFLPHRAEPAYHTFRAERIHNEWLPSEVSWCVISEVCNANHCEPTGGLVFFLLMPSRGVMVNYTRTTRNRMWRRNFIWSSIWPVESMEDTLPFGFLLYQSMILRSTLLVERVAVKVPKCKSPENTNHRKSRQAREDELYRQIYAASGLSARCVGRRGIESCEWQTAWHVQWFSTPTFCQPTSMKCAHFQNVNSRSTHGRCRAAVYYRGFQIFNHSCGVRRRRWNL